MLGAEQQEVCYVMLLAQFSNSMCVPNETFGIAPGCTGGEGASSTSLPPPPDPSLSMNRQRPGTTLAAAGAQDATAAGTAAMNRTAAGSLASSIPRREMWVARGCRGRFVCGSVTGAAAAAMRMPTAVPAAVSSGQVIHCGLAGQVSRLTSCVC